MLLFFRKIRRKLAKENKFLQYSRYAIGEILLVVIGILIALQINSWNGQRIKLKKEQLYLSEIKTSLAQDTLTVHEVLEFNKNKAKIVYGLIRMFSDTIDNQQRYAIFQEHSNQFTRFMIFKPRSTSFTNMLNSESIDLINDGELKEGLSRFYAFDYTGGIQERIKIMNRRIIDRYYSNFFTKEFALQMLDMKTDLTSISSLNIHKNQNFLSDLYGVLMVLYSQDDLLKEKMLEITSLIENIKRVQK